MSAFAEKRFIEKALKVATDTIEIAELKEKLYDAEMDCRWECMEFEENEENSNEG